MFHILVVDDDKSIRYVMKEILETAGYVAFCTESAAAALDLIEREHIDLAVVDVMMPGIDGYELTRELRAFNKELPILMVSAKVLPEDRKRGFLAGIDDYMSKPVDPDEFLLHIKALLRRFKIASERKIIIGDCVLDLDSYTVVGHGTTQELPQKEFQLLFKLLSSPGKIFTRIQLLDEIWGVECESTPETVTVHIGRLRKRFEGWEEFEIENIRGLGYKAVKRV
ncbi:MAG: response regulator transcription factor [Clostridia bacterium]|nr:response regulator transcription factor [Clostridia bacterium]MBQ8371714.1 response regulator transcription factor [Clostridia bacterium]